MELGLHKIMGLIHKLSLFMQGYRSFSWFVDGPCFPLVAGC